MTTPTPTPTRTGPGAFKWGLLIGLVLGVALWLYFSRQSPAAAAPSEDG